MKSYKEFIAEQREEWRGPHEGKEFELMMANKKPMALINHYEGTKYAKFKPSIQVGLSSIISSSPIHLPTIMGS
jgi:hypothetical protein